MCIYPSQNWKERKAAYEQVQTLFQQAQSDDSGFRDYGKLSWADTQIQCGVKCCNSLFGRVDPCGARQVSFALWHV